MFPKGFRPMVPVHPANTVKHIEHSIDSAVAHGGIIGGAERIEHHRKGCSMHIAGGKHPYKYTGKRF
jgi:hypothetical protein